MTIPKAGEAYCSATSKASLTIAYEDLVMAPERTVRRLCELLGESV